MQLLSHNHFCILEAPYAVIVLIDATTESEINTLDKENFVRKKLNRKA